MRQRGTLRTELREALQAPAQGFSSCAVVASSGLLLYDRFGEEIDRHNFVVRFNNAPTSGFEPVVGSKTSLRLLNSQAMLALLRRCALPNRCDPNPSCCGTDREGRLLNSMHPALAACFRRVCGDAPSVQELMVRERHPFFVSLLASVSRSPMSGIFGLAAADLMCSGSITVYGFTIAEGATATPYHYYDECDHAASDGLAIKRAARIFQEPVHLKLSNGIVRVRNSSRAHAAWPYRPLGAASAFKCLQSGDASNFSRSIAAAATGAARMPIGTGAYRGRMPTGRYLKIKRFSCCRAEYERSRKRGTKPRLWLAKTGPYCTAEPRECEANCTSMARCGAFSYSDVFHECYFCTSCELSDTGQPVVGRSSAMLKFTTWVLKSVANQSGMRLPGSRLP